MQGGSNGMEKFIEIPCIVLEDELIINLDVILLLIIGSPTVVQI
jgi:hypothetical protein